MFTQAITPNPDIWCRPGWCLEYVRTAFGLPAVHPSATANWEASATKHRDRAFPAGVTVPVWYGVAGVPEGHVVLRMADGSVYSTTNANSNTPRHHPNLADLERIYAGAGLPLTYRGWTEDVAGTRVITQKEDDMKIDDITPAAAGKIADAVFFKGFARQGPGVTKDTNLGAHVAWLDSNLLGLRNQITAQQAQVKSLIGAVAALSQGEAFDQAKLLAGVESAAAAGVAEALAEGLVHVTIEGMGA